MFGLLLAACRTWGVENEDRPRHAGNTRAEAAPLSYTCGVDARWYLYLIECRNGAFYAGITNDLKRRYAEHAAGRGARYTRANPPIRLLGARAYVDRSAAARAEYAIRQLPKNAKPAFLRLPAEPVRTR